MSTYYWYYWNPSNKKTSDLGIECIRHTKGVFGEKKAVDFTYCRGKPVPSGDSKYTRGYYAERLCSGTITASDVKKTKYLTGNYLGKAFTTKCSIPDYQSFCLNTKNIGTAGCLHRWVRAVYGTVPKSFNLDVSKITEQQRRETAQLLNTYLMDILESKDHDKFKRAMTEPNIRLALMSEKSSIFDQVVTAYCKIFPGDVICKCIKNKLTEKYGAGLAVMTGCDLEGGYKTAAMKQVKDVSIIDCKQYVDIDAGDRAYVSASVKQRCQSAISTKTDTKTDTKPTITKPTVTKPTSTQPAVIPPETETTTISPIIWLLVIILAIWVIMRKRGSTDVYQYRQPIYDQPRYR
jgi:hypothetical protein|uniref:Uncharacterized protein n=1 Tax=viral metagenome TaxID=1070528 RepID=A0A6C0IW74_9ZZZZ